MKEKGTFTTSEGTGGYNNKPLNQFKITMKTAVEWLQEQYNQCPKYEEQIYEQDWEQAKAIEKEQMIDAWENGKKSTQCKTPICRMKTGIGYYNKTFKQQ